MERKFKQPVCWQERSGVSVRLAYFVPNNVGSSAIALRPPNPHGAVLMADFLLSPDGQKVLEKFHYGSATKEQPFRRRRPERGVPAEKYEKDVEHWEKLLKQIGHK